MWVPGEEHGYHGQTYGYIVGELVRRVTGRTIGTYLAEEIAEPLGLETFIGLPEPLVPRVARSTYNYPPPDAKPELQPTFPDNGFGAQVFLFSHLRPDYTMPEWLHIEMPAANGVTTARSFAKLYAGAVGAVGGSRLFTSETMERARTCRTRKGAIDRVLLGPTRWGLGFIVYTPDAAMLGPSSFGHAGAGGAMGFADPESGIGFGFGCNVMGDFERACALVEAVKSSL